MKKELNVWYAVSKKGQGRVFTSCPERNEHFGIWVGDSVGFISSLVMWFEADGLSLPDLKWVDEPQKLTVSLGF